MKHTHKRFYDIVTKDQQTCSDWLLLLKAERIRALDAKYTTRAAWLEMLILDSEEFVNEIA
jgi:hypothetical protein